MKISKKDQDPRQSEKDAEALSLFLSKKSPHFAIGTYVIRSGIRGEIISMTKDGGKRLLVEWHDQVTSYGTRIAGTREIIDNPLWRNR